MWLFSLVFARAADWTIRRKLLSTTTVRKIANTTCKMKPHFYWYIETKDPTCKLTDLWGRCSARPAGHLLDGRLLHRLRFCFDHGAPDSGRRVPRSAVHGLPGQPLGPVPQLRQRHLRHHLYVRHHPQFRCPADGGYFDQRAGGDWVSFRLEGVDLFSFLFFFFLFCLLLQQTLAQWRIAFLISAGIMLFESVFYLFFGSGEEQPWNQGGESWNQQSQEGTSQYENGSLDASCHGGLKGRWIEINTPVTNLIVSRVT